MIIFAISGGSSLATKVLSDLTKNFKIYSTYNKQRPSKNLLKKINFFKLDLNNPNKNNLIKSFIKKNKLENEKIIFINFSVYKNNNLFINDSDENIKETININIKSQLDIIKIFLPIMVKNSFGRIIHLSSSKVLDGEIGTTLYSASKSFLYGFSASIAKEYGKFNITSNILSLGYFKSRLWDKIPAKIKKERIKDIPSQSLGSTGNISNAIEFIIKSEFVNKAVIKIDGGL